MEVDTGASLSQISETTFKVLWDADTALPLQQSEVKLQTYTGQEICVLGSIMVTAETQGQQACLPLFVVKGNCPNLLGRDWLAKLHLNWIEIFSVCVQRTLANILEQHQKVFEPGLSTIKGVEAKLYVDPQAQPAFFKARTVPFAEGRGRAGQDGKARSHQASAVLQMGCAYCTCHQEKRDSQGLRRL